MFPFSPGSLYQHHIHFPSRSWIPFRFARLFSSLATLLYNESSIYIYIYIEHYRSCSISPTFFRGYRGIWPWYDHGPISFRFKKSTRTRWRCPVGSDSSCLGAWCFLSSPRRKRIWFWENHSAPLKNYVCIHNYIYIYKYIYIHIDCIFVHVHHFHM